MTNNMSEVTKAMTSYFLFSATLFFMIKNMKWCPRIAVAWGEEEQLVQNAHGAILINRTIARENTTKFSAPLQTNDFRLRSKLFLDSYSFSCRLQQIGEAVSEHQADCSRKPGGLRMSKGVVPLVTSQSANSNLCFLKSRTGMDGFSLIPGGCLIF